MIDDAQLLLLDIDEVLSLKLKIIKYNKPIFDNTVGISYSREALKHLTEEIEKCSIRSAIR